MHIYVYILLVSSRFSLHLRNQRSEASHRKKKSQSRFRADLRSNNPAASAFNAFVHVGEGETSMRENRSRFEKA